MILSSCASFCPYCAGVIFGSDEESELYRCETCNKTFYIKFACNLNNYKVGSIVINLKTKTKGTIKEILPSSKSGFVGNFYKVVSFNKTSYLIEDDIILFTDYSKEENNMFNIYNNNGIFILVSPVNNTHNSCACAYEYRVAYCTEPENLLFEDCLQEKYKAKAYEYLCFYDSKVYQNKADALLRAIMLESNCPTLEYGIVTLKRNHIFPNMGVKEAYKRLHWLGDA